MPSHSESLKIATERYAAHNDKIAPPSTPQERVRAHLQSARCDLDRSLTYGKSGRDAASLGALHTAVASMLAALEVQS